MSNYLGPAQDFGGARLKSVGAPVDPNDVATKVFLAYDIAFICGGKPNAGEVFGPYLVARPGTIPANFAGTRARAKTAPAAAQTWTLKRTPAGSTTAATLGTITLNTDGTFTLSTQAAITLAIDDFIDLVAPATQDANMADVGITVFVGR